MTVDFMQFNICSLTFESLNAMDANIMFLQFDFCKVKMQWVQGNECLDHSHSTFASLTFESPNAMGKNI